ncbi:hypothetical protein [Neptunomonas antarctica]|uniref:Uncharacterized protein n=1 Tax=Neptunomonas antarctica TaxID=619304 RepID=A0A1N7IS01_9GAMM|nr:hypothetical protein [Neptunomonas antarctica]SIS39874.1 hypothetical protein SAMN05421760_10136 [Neptunomonas antarctica]
MLKVGLALLVLPCLLLMAGYMYELSGVNDCLGLGGSFNYELLACDQSNDHPFMPYTVRHPLLVNGGMMASVAGLFLCIIGLYKRR